MIFKITLDYLKRVLPYCDCQKMSVLLKWLSFNMKQMREMVKRIGFITYIFIINLLHQLNAKVLLLVLKHFFSFWVMSTCGLVYITCSMYSSWPLTHVAISWIMHPMHPEVFLTVIMAYIYTSYRLICNKHVLVLHVGKKKTTVVIQSNMLKVKA